MLPKLYAFWFLDESRRTRVLLVAWIAIVLAGLITSSYFASALLGIGIAVFWPILQPLGSTLRGVDLTVRRAVAAILMMFMLVALPLASARMQQSLITSSLQALISGELTADQVIRVERALTEGARAGIHLDRGLLTRTGQTLLTGHDLESSPAMWRLVTGIIDYQSSLRRELVPDVRSATPVDANDKMAWVFPMGAHGGNWLPSKIPIIDRYGSVPAAEGAVAEPIASPFHSNMPMRPQYLIISYPPGLTLDLGYWRFKNVIIRDSDVSYDGSPLLLENVFFVNCRFSIKETANRSRLVMALMTPGAVQFKS